MQEVSYQDPKRYWWLLSVAAPSLPGIAAVMIWLTGNPLWAVMPIVFGYVLYPILDMVIGEDPNNPPEEAVEAMENDPWYRLLLFASLPVFWFSLVAAALAATLPQTPWWAFLLLALSAGISSGTAITVGHELGHKLNRLDQWGAKIANAVSGYGHFCIEHNRGHHVWVATPQDPASARMGECLWRFALREIPGTAKRGWEMERDRLVRKGTGFWNWRNDVLQGYAITLAITIILTLIGGPLVIGFMIISCIVGWFHLTMANYVEHYGLLRRIQENGKPEPCEPRHSWNTNHIVTNLMLFHLQRHSDHHANPLRPYQALRNFAELPRLPSGYPGSFLLAMFPPLWFRVMDPKVMEWANGKLDNVNLDSSRSAEYRLRFA